MFEQELNYFIAHQSELVLKHPGRILVIKGNEVVGVYKNPLEAFTEAQKIYPAGSFMLQPCVPGPEAYTVTITSNLWATC